MPKATGCCLCSSIYFEIHGQLRDVINCHCPSCRRIHGAYGAYSNALDSDIHFLRDDTLCWYVSSVEGKNMRRRAFCQQCGSSLFWQIQGSGRTAISAGVLSNVRLQTVAHIWVSLKADFYTISDSLPQFRTGLPRDFSVTTNH